jgi:hypothetical protein
MSQAARIDVVGACTISPANVITGYTQAAPSLSATFNLGSSRTYPKHKEGSESLSAAVNFALPLGGITAVRFLALRVIAGSLLVKVTSAAGTDQAFRVSDLLIIGAPTAGDELTAVKLTGSGDVEFIAAGA